MMAERAETHPRAIPLAGWAELTSEYAEIARFWVSNQRSFVVVAADVVPSPALLGSLLVECVETAAAGYASQGAMSESEALAELWRGFDQERLRLGNLQTERPN